MESKNNEQKKCDSPEPRNEDEESDNNEQKKCDSPEPAPTIYRNEDEEPQQATKQPDSTAIKNPLSLISLALSASQLKDAYHQAKEAHNSMLANLVSLTSL